MGDDRHLLAGVGSPQAVDQPPGAGQDVFRGLVAGRQVGVEPPALGLQLGGGAALVRAADLVGQGGEAHRQVVRAGDGGGRLPGAQARAADHGGQRPVAQIGGGCGGLLAAAPAQAKARHPPVKDVLRVVHFAMTDEMDDRHRACRDRAGGGGTRPPGTYGRSKAGAGGRSAPARARQRLLYPFRRRFQRRPRSAPPPGIRGCRARLFPGWRWPARIARR